MCEGNESGDVLSVDVGGWDSVWSLWIARYSILSYMDIQEQRNLHYFHNLDVKRSRGMVWNMGMWGMRCL